MNPELIISGMVVFTLSMFQFFNWLISKIPIHFTSSVAQGSLSSIPRGLRSFIFVEAKDKLRVRSTITTLFSAICAAIAVMVLFKLSGIGTDSIDDDDPLDEINTIVGTNPTEGADPVKPIEENQSDEGKPAPSIAPEYKWPIVHLNETNEMLFSKSVGANKEGKTLMFMHIPKTGGAGIATAAGKVGIGWGWGFSALQHINTPFWEDFCRGCPQCKFDGGEDTGQSQPFHTPLSCWIEDFMKDAPKQTENTLQWYFDLENVDYFCVIRHPFNKMVSEYAWRENLGIPPEYDCSAKMMNQWLQLKMGQLQNGTMHSRAGDHFFPQYDYVFDSNGEQICKHVIPIDHSEEEFRRLFKEYNIESVMDHYERRNISPCRLTVKDLTLDTMEMIYRVYEKDFYAFDFEFGAH